MKRTFQKNSLPHPLYKEKGGKTGKERLLTLLFLMLSVCAFGQTSFSVKGTVASENGEGLPGASVILKGTSTGTTTDVEGKYSLNVPDANGTLVFTYIGYVNQEYCAGQPQPAGCETGDQ